MKKIVRFLAVVMAMALMLTFVGCSVQTPAPTDATTTAKPVTNPTTTANQTQVQTTTLGSDVTTAHQVAGITTTASAQKTTTQVKTTMPDNLKITTTAKKTEKPVATKNPMLTTVPKGTASKDKLVALSFDDGPSIQTTNLMLDKLEKYNVVATFMLIGQNVHSGTQAVMKRTLSLGCELGNHSYTHRRMGAMSAAEIREEIEDTQDVIERYAGVTPTTFRPPFIDVSQTMYNNIPLTFICGIGADDWDANVTAKQRADRIINNVKDGDIILLHDFAGNNATAEALDTIISTL